jgi:hypothetical protein
VHAEARAVARRIEALDAAELHARAHHGTGRLALRQQQAQQAAGRVVAEELAVLALVVGHAVGVDEGQEVLGREAREGGAREVRVVGDVVGGGDAAVAEVGAAAAADEDLEAEARVALEDQRAPAARRGGGGGHQPRGAAAQHEDVEAQLVGHAGTPGGPAWIRGGPFA